MSKHSLAKEEALLLKTIQGLKEHQSQLEATIADRKKRLNELEAEISASTAAAFEKRDAVLTAQLKVRREDAEKQIAGLERQITDTSQRLDILVEQVTASHNLLTETNAKIAEKQGELTDLGAVHGQLTLLEAKAARFKGDISRLHNEQLGVQNAINDLTRQKGDLESVIGQLEPRLNELRTLITSAETELQVISQEKQDKITVLDSKIAVRRQEYQQYELSADQERRDLADRELELNNRERTLKLRERKVEQSEERIQQNADLLNL